MVADAGVGDRADRADVKQEEHDARGVRDDVCLGRQGGIERGQGQQDDPQRDEPGPGLASAVEEDGDERRQEGRQNHPARVDEAAEKVMKRNRSEENDERLLKPEALEVAREEERDHAEDRQQPGRRPARAPRAARRGCNRRPPGTDRPALSPGRPPAAAASCGAPRRRRPASPRTTPGAPTGVQGPDGPRPESASRSFTPPARRVLRRPRPFRKQSRQRTRCARATVLMMDRGRKGVNVPTRGRCPRFRPCPTSTRSPCAVVLPAVPAAADTDDRRRQRGHAHFAHASFVRIHVLSGL